MRPEQAHARNIAPGSIKARDDADHDRIAGADKDNRNFSVVAALATGAAGVFAAMTATLRRTRSAAITSRRSY